MILSPYLQVLRPLPQGSGGKHQAAGNCRMPKIAWPWSGYNCFRILHYHAKTSLGCPHSCARHGGVSGVRLACSRTNLNITRHVKSMKAHGSLSLPLDLFKPFPWASKPFRLRPWPPSSNHRSVRSQARAWTQIGCPREIQKYRCLYDSAYALCG